MAKTAKTTQEAAVSLRNCIAYLLDEAMEAKLLMVALHLKLALDEAAEAAAPDQYKPDTLQQAS